MIKIESFTEEQVNEIVKGFVNNFEIRGGFVSQPFVEDIVQKYSDVIDPELRKRYEACPEIQRLRKLEDASRNL